MPLGKIWALRVSIVDYGSANILSLVSCLERLGITPKVITDYKDDLTSFDYVILPGVGSFDNAMQFLNESKISDSLSNLFRDSNCGVLGICLGMQLMFTSSEEGRLKGLQLIPGNVLSLNTQEERFKIPVLGWSNVIPREGHNSAFSIPSNHNFYFAHSYFAQPSDAEVVTHFVSYGNNPIPAVVIKDNFLGVQFHPERSGLAGENFLRKYFMKKQND